jgi:pimeloyl-ACP methyl ester carboxylesterase
VATFVLVHGAWQGPWCWERLAPLLGRSGHRVLTPTLTGCGDDAARLSPEITLDTHVHDVSAVVDDIAESDVLLVGHSYAGMVISEVADSRADKLAGLAYLDGFYPRDGDSALGLMPPQFQGLFRQRAAEDGDGWRLPANDGLLDVWGLHDPTDRVWVRERLTDWSLVCFESPVHLPNGGRQHVPRSFLSGVAEDYPGRAVFAPMAQRAQADGCRLHELPTGHDLMIEASDAVADILLSTAAR